MAMSGLVFSMVVQASGNVFLAVFAAIFTGIAAGLLNGFLVVHIGVPSIIATIGTQFFWRGAAIVLADGLARNLASVRESFTYEILVGRLFGIIPAQSLWCLGIAVLLWFMLNLV